MNNPFDFFGKIYCINMPEDTERKKQVSKEFEKANIINRIEWISAAKPPKDFHIDLYRRNPAAEFGCSLSHITAIVNAINDKHDNILILEDDITFVNNFSNILTNSLDELPNDWTGLYLGCTPVNKKKISKTLIKINGWNTWGTYAYALNGKHLLKYFNHWAKSITHPVAGNLYSPIDAILSSFMDSNSGGYATIPPIVKPKIGIVSSVDNSKYNSAGHDKHWNNLK